MPKIYSDRFRDKLSKRGSEDNGWGLSKVWCIFSVLVLKTSKHGQIHCGVPKGSNGAVWGGGGGGVRTPF